MENNNLATRNFNSRNFNSRNFNLNSIVQANKTQPAGAAANHRTNWTNPVRKAAGLAGIVAMSFGIVACTPAEAANDAHAPATDNAPAVRVSPLDEFLGAVWGTSMSPAEQQRRVDEENMRREEKIAQCMNEAGFEYRPNAAAAGTVLIEDNEGWNPNSPEFVSQYGFGAINYPGRDTARAASAEGNTENAPQDPNADYIKTLSEAEQQAWQTTLWGADFEDQQSGILDANWMSGAGCFGWAQEQISADSGFDVINSDEFAPLFEAIAVMQESLLTDHRLADVDARWSTCMADKGFTGLYRQSDAQLSFFDEFTQFFMTWDFESEADPMQSPEIKKLGEREVAIAVADLDCREATGYREIQEKIADEVEKQFVNDHRTELEALRNAATQRA